MRTIVGLAMVGVSALTLLVSSCKKDDEKALTTPVAKPEAEAPVTPVVLAKEVLKTQSEVTDISFVVIQGFVDQNVYNARVAAGQGVANLDCGTSSKFAAGDSSYVLIDFGATNVTCSDGKQRRGKIRAYFTGRSYNEANKVVYIEFLDFYVNDNRLDGFERSLSNGNYRYTITGKTKVTYPDGSFTETTVSREKRKTAGIATVNDLSDDAYEITGTSTGVARGNVPFTTTIRTPIVVKQACSEAKTYYPVSGILETSEQGSPTRSINFGDGGCDNAALITIEGQVYSITL